MDTEYLKELISLLFIKRETLHVSLFRISKLVVRLSCRNEICSLSEEYLYVVLPATSTTTI